MFPCRASYTRLSLQEGPACGMFIPVDRAGGAEDEVDSGGEWEPQGAPLVAAFAPVQGSAAARDAASWRMMRRTVAGAVVLVALAPLLLITSPRRPPRDANVEATVISSPRVVAADHLAQPGLLEEAPWKPILGPIEKFKASSRRSGPSCTSFGCGAFAPGRSCQCNSKCQVYMDCCPDFRSTCAMGSPPESGLSFSAASSGRAASSPVGGPPTAAAGGTRSVGKIALDEADRENPDLLVWPHKPTCICIFDVDRTLTAKQGHASECEGAEEVPGVDDSSYGGGGLVLSELGRRLNTTFCGQCYRGVVSHGYASGADSKEREVLLSALGGISWTLSDVWSPPAPRVQSTLVVGAPDMHKQDSVRGILQWLMEERGVKLSDERVFFYDDNAVNTPPFVGSGFNARQISCGSQEGAIGLCGGRTSEVVPVAGVVPCEGTAVVLRPEPTPAPAPARGMTASPFPASAG